jgi:glycerol transport system ATP-binding protein
MTAYNMGLRPHHIKPKGKGTEVEADIQIAEITGSDSIIRLSVEGNNWVSESAGIHIFDVGDKAKFLIDTERCLYFDQNDQFIGA